VKRNLIFSVVVAVCLVAALIVYLRLTSPAGMSARVASADDREFFPAVHSLLISAERSVDVILYQGRFYFHYPASKSNTMICDLIDASERGVDVRVVIERADWNADNTEENRDVAQVLEGSGVEVYFDPPGTTSHTKLVIVDGRYVVVGSTNWSHYALDSNNEANLVIESDGVARAFTDYFEGILGASDRDYTSPIEPIAAEEFLESSGRYVLVRDECDSASYDPDSHTGYIHFEGLKAAVSERPLEEILVLQPLFFTEAQGETVRVLGRINLEGDVDLDALDVESGGTLEAIALALDREREEIKAADFEAASLEWFDGARVKPIPNRVYAEELRKLIDSATDRIWIAMADARYYDSTPRTASKTKEPGEIPSLTNMVLAELVQAAVDGIDVRLVCDMGWRGSPPPDRVTFMGKLKAAGGKVYEDSREVTTHAKMAIVDDDFAVVGSTNWSYHALEENNESAVIVESESLNDHYAAYIQAIIDAGQPFEE
jgi:phosphatidylserine/phosphatidylglycerophosphate/cardiolipin synthase-like enzyme